jgi:hypothetical protein
MTFDFHPLPGADEVSEDIMVTGHHHTHTNIDYTHSHCVGFAGTNKRATFRTLLWGFFRQSRRYVAIEGH